MRKVISIFFIFLTLLPVEKVFKVGVIRLPAQYAEDIEKGLKKQLEIMGFKEGKNLIYISKIGYPEYVNYGKNRDIAKEFLNESVDVIVTIGTGASISVWDIVKNSNIPQVFVGVTYPIQGGLIENFDVPTNKNITGISYGVSPETRLKIFRILLPDTLRFKNLGFVYSSVIEQETIYVNELKNLKNTSGFNIKFIDIYNKEKKKNDFNILKNLSTSMNIDLIFGWYSLDELFTKEDLGNEFIEFKIPIMGITSKHTDMGALGGILTDHIHLGIETAKILGQIYNGESIENIPPTIPKNYIFEINLKKAKELNIDIPKEALKLAHRIVQ